MIDLLYLGVTFLFFGAMLAYVHGCLVLGREDSADLREKDER